MKRVAILFLAFAAVSFAAQAQPRQGKMHKGNIKDGNNPKVHVYSISDKGCMIPDLSQEQKDEIKKYRLDMVKENTSIHNQIAEKRARLNTLQSEDKANMSAINKTIDEIAALQAQQMKSKASFHVKVRALLNDEQKVAFDSRKHHNHSFGFDRGMRHMKMRTFKFGDDDFGVFNEKIEGLEALNNIDFNAITEHHFELEVED